ncbi:MAG: NAD(P)/FAD-dependent oxidoreductase, partial [Solirubrobacteraceae bacterium]
DRAARSITLDDGRSIRFDSLVIATGGTPRWLPGVPRAQNVLALRTLDDSVDLKRALAESHRLLVVGAGFIGAEVAASARALGKEVLLVEAEPVPLGRALGQEMGHVYAQIHREHGVDLRTGTTVSEWVAAGDRLVAVVLSDGQREVVDAALIAVGIEPDLTMARALNLKEVAGGVDVDGSLQAEAGIFCAGDIAAHRHPLYGRPLRVEHWQVAREQGRTVGRSVAGAVQAHADLPWFWSDQYDVKLQYLGNARGFDQELWRGERASGRYAIFYLKDGLIDAVLAVNDARTIRFSRELIRRRQPVDPGLLAAPSTDLRALAEARGA